MVVLRELLLLFHLCTVLEDGMGEGKEETISTSRNLLPSALIFNSQVASLF